MPGRAREEAWKEKERGQENRQAEGGAARTETVWLNYEPETEELL